MQFSANVTAAVALLLASNCLFAQDLKLPTQAEIQAQMSKYKEGANSALSNTPGKPPGGFVAKVPQVGAPSPARKQSLDEVISQYNQAKDGKVGKPGTNDLIIFVSFSMPNDVLAELSRQAKEFGAVMVIRGFKDGSLLATKRAALMANKGRVEWEIHPELFKAFKVESVPAFVVASADAESVLEDGCSPEASYTSITGDMSLELALDTIRRRGQPEIAKLAAARLDAYRKKNEHRLR